MNGNKTLDAVGPGHMAGKYINDGKISGKSINTRFGSSLRAYTCKTTGSIYKSSVSATKLFGRVKTSMQPTVARSPGLTPRVMEVRVGLTLNPTKNQIQLPKIWLKGTWTFADA